MKKGIILCVLVLLAGCGPKEIGTGLAETPSASGGGASAAELMRYPVTGTSNTQKMLYYTNRPDVMEMTQKWQAASYRERMGINPEDPAYREKPQQRSPFRQ